MTWRSVFGVLEAPSLGAIIGLGLLLTAIFLAWLLGATLIWRMTLGMTAPDSIGLFLGEVFATRAGWALIVFGIAVGFGFAALVFSITVVSFPLLLDRHAKLRTAIGVSIGVIAANPGPMAVWGAVVAACLIVGTLPCLVGLAVVLPVLGHATWHLYRRAVR